MIPESRADVDRDIEATLGLVPEFFKQVPDCLIPTEWASFKSLELSDQTAIPNKYKELVGLAVSGATRCRTAATSTRRRRDCLAPARTRSPRPR
jgi:alkylhydroperoxidase/carboxymuconolactone decarboxylase family protein YurZ